MTAEFGPRDVDLSSRERFAGRLLDLSTRFLNHGSDSKSMYYRRDSATLTLHGESEYAGDVFNRGKMALYPLLISNYFTTMLLVTAGVLPDFGNPAIGGLKLLVFIAVAWVWYCNTTGSIILASKIDVVDHTTQPDPEELDELQSQFVDGEIEQTELEARVEEVMQRE